MKKYIFFFVVGMFFISCTEIRNTKAEIIFKKNESLFNSMTNAILKSYSKYFLNDTIKNNYHSISIYEGDTLLGKVINSLDCSVDFISLYRDSLIVFHFKFEDLAKNEPVIIFTKAPTRIDLKDRLNYEGGTLKLSENFFLKDINNNIAN